MGGRKFDCEIPLLSSFLHLHGEVEKRRRRKVSSLIHVRNSRVRGRHACFGVCDPRSLVKILTVYSIRPGV